MQAVVRPLLGDGVEWLGEVGWERKLTLLAAARCLLFPIRWEEPFGIVMAEAMACGTPVVALRRGSVPEVVTPRLDRRIDRAATPGAHRRQRIRRFRAWMSRTG